MDLLFFQKTIFTPLYGLNYIFVDINDNNKIHSKYLDLEVTLGSVTPQIEAAATRD